MTVSHRQSLSKAKGGGKKLNWLTQPDRPKEVGNKNFLISTKLKYCAEILAKQ